MAVLGTLSKILAIVLLFAIFNEYKRSNELRLAIIKNQDLFYSRLNSLSIPIQQYKTDKQIDNLLLAQQALERLGESNDETRSRGLNGKGGN